MSEKKKRSSIVTIVGMAAIAITTAGCPVTTSNPPPVDTGDSGESEDSGESDRSEG